MEESNEWISFTNKKKCNLFKKYIENMIEDNENNYENETIDNLTYSKNKIFLQTLKKDKIRYKNIENKNIIIKDDIIYQINNIEKNKDGLIHFVNNKNHYKNQTRITDYNYKYKKKNNNNIESDNKKNILNINTNLAFLTK